MDDLFQHTVYKGMKRKHISLHRIAMGEEKKQKKKKKDKKRKRDHHGDESGRTSTAFDLQEKDSGKKTTGNVQRCLALIVSIA